MGRKVALIYRKQKLEPFVASGADGLTFRKQLIYPGTFHKGSRTFTVTEGDIDHWVATHKELLLSGLDVPLPVEHTTDPEKRRGTVLDLEKAPDEKGRPSLYAKVQFSDAKAAELAKTANVSVFVPPTWQAGSGKIFERPVRHVALTDYPVVPGLDGFQTIAASYGDMSMATGIDWAPIGALLDLPEGVELNDDNAAELILVKLTDLKARIAEETGEPKKPDEKKPEEPKPGDAPKPGEKPAEPAVPPAMAASMAKLIRQNRSMVLSQLSAGGRLPKAARDLADKQWLSDAAIAASMSGSGDEAFDGFVATINAMPALSGERTPGQYMALSNGGQGGDGKGLVKAMEARPLKPGQVR